MQFISPPSTGLAVDRGLAVQKSPTDRKALSAATNFSSFHVPDASLLIQSQFGRSVRGALCFQTPKWWYDFSEFEWAVVQSRELAMVKPNMEEIKRECDELSKAYRGVWRSIFRSGYYIAREAGLSKEKAMQLASKYAKQESTD